MKVINEIEIYEVDGREVKPSDCGRLVISSHWNRDDFVVIKLSGVAITVSVRKLLPAIQNATNWKR